MLTGTAINAAFKLRDGDAGRHRLRSHLECDLVRVEPGEGVEGLRRRGARPLGCRAVREAVRTDAGTAALGSRVSPRRRLRKGEPRARFGSSGPAALKPSRCYRF